MDQNRKNIESDSRDTQNIFATEIAQSFLTQVYKFSKCI